MPIFDFMKKLIYCACFFLSSFAGISQDTSRNNMLTPEEFLAIVRTYHPVIKQADIGIEMASAEILAARGAFDPYFYLNSDQKTFDGKRYYQHTNPELKIPTWYGIELKAGLENNTGEFLNSESTFGKTSYAGISVSLARNLVIDPRRAALQQAKIFRNQSYAERQVIINDLLDQAIYAYWNWVKALRIRQLLQDAVKVNEARLQLIKTASQLGDRPAIDTIEALSQLQSFQGLEAEAILNAKNAAVELSNFLWKENNSYYILPDQTVSDTRWNEIGIDTIALPSLTDLLAAIPLTHPKLKYFGFKMNVLEVDRKLKFQELLPIVNLRANVLNRGYEVWKGTNTAGFYENNNKFGIDIGVPLRFSKGRAAYKIARLKIQETGFEISMTQQQIENKVNYYFNQLAGYQQQVRIYENAYKNYQTLLRGEEIRFRGGESSLFLLNIRENKVIEAGIKLTETKIKFYQSQVALQAAAGLLR